MKNILYFISMSLSLFSLPTNLLGTPPPETNLESKNIYLKMGFLLGHSSNKNLVAVDRRYLANPNRQEKLLILAQRDFYRMVKAAQKEGIELKLISAYRSFHRQKNIWERKWKGQTLVDGMDLATWDDGQKKTKKILEYSAAPGLSRHHWGTEIDLNSLNHSYFQTKNGRKVYMWLTKNATKFGFCQPYDNSSKRTGYRPEPWHWSYKPLSAIFTRFLLQKLKPQDIQGFSGAVYVIKNNTYQDYVGGISNACQ